MLFSLSFYLQPFKILARKMHTQNQTGPKASLIFFEILFPEVPKFDRLATLGQGRPKNGQFFKSLFHPDVMYINQHKIDC